MASSKPSKKKNTGDKTAGKPVGKAVKKTTRKKTAKKSAKKTKKNIPGASTDAETTVVYYFPHEKVASTGAAWSRNAWATVGQTVDPAGKVLRVVVDKVTRAGKEIHPKDVYRRIFDNIEKFDFAWGFSKEKNPAPVKQTTTKPPTKTKDKKTGTKGAAKTKTVKKTSKKASKNSTKKATGKKRAPR